MSFKEYGKECSESKLPSYLESVEVDQVTDNYGGLVSITKYRLTVKWREGYVRTQTFNSIENLNKELNFYLK